MVRCLLKTCPTSGVESSSTEQNDLCSRSWDMARASKWAREQVRDGVGARPGAKDDVLPGGAVHNLAGF